MNSRIFLSYRRGDTTGSAGRLYDKLKQTFPADSIFMDVDAVAPGARFAKLIEQAIVTSDVVLAVIGKNWVNAVDNSGRRRLDNDADFVRLEVATALAQDKTVIPVLVEGADMPRPDELPESMQGLAYFNAAEITHSRFDADTERLVSAVDALLKEADRERLSRHGQSEDLAVVPHSSDAAVADMAAGAEFFELEGDGAEAIATQAPTVAQKPKRRLLRRMGKLLAGAAVLGIVTIPAAAIIAENSDKARAEDAAGGVSLLALIFGAIAGVVCGGDRSLLKWPVLLWLVGAAIASAGAGKIAAGIVVGGLPGAVIGILIAALVRYRRSRRACAT